MCSLYHEGEANPSLARMEIVRQPLTAEFGCHICQQCTHPDCYHACPTLDEAICIDESTGTVYIDEDLCLGCEECVDACPFDPARIKFNDAKNVVSKCDLCRDREDGPICVEYCPVDALLYTPRR